MISPHERPHAALPLRLSIASWMLGDGSPTPPVVGEIGEYRIAFREEAEHDPSDAAVSELIGTATSEGEPTPFGRRGETKTLCWPTTLQGPGWEVSWMSPRPPGGVERVGGSVYADHVYYGKPKSVRGRILRVQIESVLMRVNHKLGRWEAIPGTYEYRDVETCPQWFGGRETTGPDEAREEWAAIVDLDLAVPPPDLTPRLLPGAVAVDGDVAWIADWSRPIVVRLDLSTNDIREYVLPEPVGGFSGAPPIWCDGSTCWIGRPTGLYRIAGDDVRKVCDEAPDRVLRGHGGRLLVINRRESSRLHLLPDGADELPPFLFEGGWMESAITAADGFLLLMSNGATDPEDRNHRLVRVGASGSVDVGPVLHELGPNPGGLSGRPVRINGSHAGLAAVEDRDGSPRVQWVDGYEVQRDLTVQPISGEPQPPRTYAALDGEPWTVVWVPGDRDRSQWWEFDEPCPHPDGEEARLLVRLHPETLQPVAIAPVPFQHPTVARHGDDFLVATVSALYRWSGTGYSELVEIPVAQMLAR